MGNVDSKIADHNLQVLLSLDVGDRIKFRRGIYSHWGLYFGDGKVIHLTGVDESHIHSQAVHSFTINGRRFNKATVKIHDFFDVCEGEKAYRNNDYDRYKSPCDAGVIIARAVRFLDRNMPYNLFGFNCEHFATWCRNTVSHSKQVNNLAVGGAAGSMVVTTLAVVGGVLGAVLSRH